MNDSHRACQFLPFNGLRGFEELIKQAEAPKVTRREMTEDHAQELNNQLQWLKRGAYVELIYYTPVGYVTRTCIVLEINPSLHYLRTSIGYIPFGDLWQIKPIKKSPR